MLLHTSCKLTFHIELPTPFVLMLRPRNGAQQWISREKYLLFPSVPAVEFTDNYRNLCQRLVAMPGEFKIQASARVKTTDWINVASGGDFVGAQYLPDSVLRYLLPSRYCESDRFGEMAMQITADQKPGYDQVEAINQWLQKTISYKPGSSYLWLSAVEINQQQSGVFRDLAHLGIALCRSLCIPPRLVVGYLYDLRPMGPHAWFEACVAGRWYTFDAT